jgi:hypothetical protein
MIEIITNSILDAKEKYIAHICNLVTSHSAGTAKAIFDKYPYANTYKDRSEPCDKSMLGTFDILGDGNNQRYVINCYSMYYPGKPKYSNSLLDGTLPRQKYFYQCLSQIAKIPDLDSIAFPYKIGCNLAGGNWDYYLGVLNNFTKHVEIKGVKVSIYKLENIE